MKTISQLSTCRGMTQAGQRCRRTVSGRRQYCHQHATQPSCRQRLRCKIKKNMIEYKQGRWVSPQQAVAVSYSQINRQYPGCQRVLRRK